MLVGEPARVGEGSRPRGRAPGLQPRLLRASRPPRPRRDPGDERGRAEGRDVPRLPPRGDDAGRDPSAAATRSTTRSGASCRRTSPAGTRAPARRPRDRRSPCRADPRSRRRRGERVRPLPLSGVPRARGRHPHAGDREPGTADIDAGRRPRGARRRRRSTRSLPTATRAARSRATASARRAPTSTGRATGLVSVFVRDRARRPGARRRPGGGPGRRSSRVHDPAVPRAIRPRLAEQVRAAERDGWTVERVDGADVAARRSSTRSSRSTSRRCAGSRPASATSSTARSTRPPSPSAGSALLLARSPGRGARRRGDPLAERPPSPLLPRRDRRRGARRVAVQERRRRDARPRRRGRAAPQPRRRRPPGDGLERFKRGLRERRGALVRPPDRLRPARPTPS